MALEATAKKCLRSLNDPDVAGPMSFMQASFTSAVELSVWPLRSPRRCNCARTRSSP
jgi:hypothetical protein